MGNKDHTNRLFHFRFFIRKLSVSSIIIDVEKNQKATKKILPCNRLLTFIVSLRKGSSVYSFIFFGGCGVTKKGFMIQNSRRIRALIHNVVGKSELKMKVTRG